LAGYASLCWIERPIGVFDSTEASKAVDKAEAEINKLLLHRHTAAEVSAEDIKLTMNKAYAKWYVDMVDKSKPNNVFEDDLIANAVHKKYRSYEREATP